MPCKRVWLASVFHSLAVHMAVQRVVPAQQLPAKSVERLSCEGGGKRRINEVAMCPELSVNKVQSFKWALESCPPLLQLLWRLMRS